MDAMRNQAESNSATVHHDLNDKQGEMLPHYVYRLYGKHIGIDGLATYWAIKSYQGRKKDAWPKCKTLAEDMDCSRHTIMRAIKKLERFELLEVHREKGKPNRYSIRTPSTDLSLTATTTCRSQQQLPVAHSNNYLSLTATTPVAHSNNLGSDYIEYPSEHNEVNTVKEKPSCSPPADKNPDEHTCQFFDRAFLCGHMSQAIKLIESLSEVKTRIFPHENLHRFIHQYSLEDLKLVYEYHIGKLNPVTQEQLNPAYVLSPKMVEQKLEYARAESKPDESWRTAFPDSPFKPVL